jgi:hypothetical protein
VFGERFACATFRGRRTHAKIYRSVYRTLLDAYRTFPSPKYSGQYRLACLGGDSLMSDECSPRLILVERESEGERVQLEKKS